MTPPAASNRPRARLELVAAVARNGVIGAGNTLPWRLPEDLRHFRALTTGHSIVMGRKTWQSLSRPLPERQNIVVTRQTGFAALGADVASSLDAAIAIADRAGPVFCIGGAELYALALPQVTTLHLTRIDHDYEGDTWFPPVDPSQWDEVARVPGSSAEGISFSFVTLRRRGAE